MARLHEYQGKKLLETHGIEIPRGEIARTPEEAFAITERIGKPVVVKAQIHNTSRAASGAIKFADTPLESLATAQEIFAKTAAEALLVDEKLEIEREFYLGFIIDDRLKRPTLLLNAAGGSGVEERAASMKTFVCSVRQEPDLERLKTFVFQTVFFNQPSEKVDIFSFETNDLLASKRALDLSIQLAEILIKLYRTAKSCEARVAEINPLALLEDGRLVALDARISVDDYAVFRHEDLGIDIARELGHAPTKLERIAWEVEKEDFRGTFYFVEILEEANKDGILIGFHGAGGGGSMASLDAAQRNDLQPACYVDTSGNPPASKVYRAARIILSIPNIKGYFLSGSGVASQEQFGLARAVIKAFLEVQPEIPAVLRLGGNGEEIAAQIVEKYAEYLPAPIEAYQKIHSADFCAARLKELIEQPSVVSRQSSVVFATDNGQRMMDDRQFYSFKSRTGRIFYDHAALAGHDTTAMIESCPTKILSKNERGLPVLNITEEEAERGKCVECLACEFAAWDILGVRRGAKIEFPIQFM
jgi:succinyl-CoA synthetase beta subunit